MDEAQTHRGRDGAPPRTVPQPDGAVDRDALHSADYGGRRAPEAEEVKQGGLTADEADGGGRKPTGERDRDYDPDGDRLGR